jgi:hypothetical protein
VLLQFSFLEVLNCLSSNRIVMNRELSRKEKDEQIMNALYHYVDHKLVSKSEEASEASL